MTAPSSAMMGSGAAQGGGAGSRAQSTGGYNVLKQEPPLRADPEALDARDGSRLDRFGSEFASQTQMLLIRDRQIEYNVRMLCGQQWNVWHPTLGRFFDVTDWLTNDQKAWRKLPVINKLLRYFVITHSRLTEGEPILTMLPGPDRVDAMLAEVLDTLFKKDWRDAGMEEVHDELMMWMVVAGRAHAISRIDLTGGEWQPWIGEARLPMLRPDGEPHTDPDTGELLLSPQAVPNVPLDQDGNPNAVLGPDGQVQHLGPPHMERTGRIAVDPYSPLQVRGQWGPQLWHRKKWHTVQRFLSPEEVFEAWGVEVEPDLSAQSAANVATLERVLFGSGFFGASMGRIGNGWADPNAKGPLCTVYERWQAPVPFNSKLQGTWAEAMMETPEQPGGRHTVWTPTRVILDGPREVAWPYTSPIRCYDFIRLPGRPSGTTPLEMLLGPQRSYNTSRAQLLEQAALLGNPQTVIDKDAGIQPSQLTNEPGKIYVATKRPGVSAVEYIAAPPVSPDVIKAIAYAADEIDELGGLRGTEGAPPTDNPSGTLIQELRVNADRLLGATARRSVKEYGRMADDWRALYKLIYSEPTVIAINGEDNLAETLTVLPHLFEEGHVNVTPDAESMLPEGRGERQARAQWMWQNGVFGDPLSNDAREIFLQQSRFPNYARMSKPGGVDYETAKLENGKILSGELQQAVLQWYDHFVHLSVHERYMKAPEFLKQPPQVQMAFAFHRQIHLQFIQEILAQQAAMQPEPGAMGPDGQPAPGGPPGAPAPQGGGEPRSLGNGAQPPVTPRTPDTAKSVAEQGGRPATALSRPRT